MRTDRIDRKIIAALMDDGRASFRQIAQRTSLTTPTVSARVARMTKAGLIEGFIPVLSVEPIERGISALVTMRASSGSPEKLSSSLAKLPEVQDAYLTTGQCVTVKLNLRRPQELQSFLGRAFMKREGAKVISSQIVTRIVKEEPRASAARFSSSSSLAGVASMDLKCDYCQGEVTSARPYTTSVGSSHYYFCCKTCKKEYLEKHGSRLAKLGLKGGLYIRKDAGLSSPPSRSHLHGLRPNLRDVRRREHSGAEGRGRGVTYYFCSESCMQRVPGPGEGAPRAQARARGGAAALRPDTAPHLPAAPPTRTSDYSPLRAGDAHPAPRRAEVLQGAYDAIKNRAGNMDVLIALGTSAAWAYSTVVTFAPGLSVLLRRILRHRGGHNHPGTSRAGFSSTLTKEQGFGRREEARRPPTGRGPEVDAAIQRPRPTSPVEESRSRCGTSSSSGQGRRYPSTR